MTSKALQYVKVCESFPAARSSNCHLLAMARIPTYWSINTTYIECYNPFHKSKIAFDYFMPFHLLRQSRLRTHVLSNQNQPRRTLIKTMNDSWPRIALSILQIWIVRQQRIDKCIICVPR